MKLDKEEFSDFISLLNEGTIAPMQADLEKCIKNVQCIESFLDDLAVAIKALENSILNDSPGLTIEDSNIKLAAGRYKTLDAQNCLSCGDFEQTTKKTDNRLIGLHAKNGGSQAD